MQVRLIPDPLGAVPQHYFFLRPRPGFGIQSAAEFFTTLDRTHIAGRGFISYRITFFIDCSLSEYAAQLGLARVRGLAILLARTAFTLLAYHRNACAIHLHIQN